MVKAKSKSTNRKSIQPVMNAADRKNRRILLGLGAVSIGIGSFLGGPVLVSEIGRLFSEGKKQDYDTKITLERFSQLPEYRKKEAISYLDSYYMDTPTGKLVGNINKSVTIEELVVPSLPPLVVFRYDLYKDKMLKVNFPSAVLASLYLNGEPYRLAEAHEKIHAEQNRNTPKDEFEQFVATHAVRSGTGLDYETVIEVSNKDYIDFAKKWLGQEVSVQDSKNLIGRLGKERAPINKVKKIIIETNAYLSLLNLSADDLYEKLSGPGYRRLGKSITFEEFNSLYESTIKLLAIKDLIESAKFVGQNHESIGRFVESVAKLETIAPYDSKKSAQRLAQLSHDKELIRYESARHINEVCDKLKIK